MALPMVCPLGKAKPVACDTGSTSSGRCRPTAALTALLSSAPPMPVTATNSARRGRLRTSR